MHVHSDSSRCTTDFYLIDWLLGLTVYMCVDCYRLMVKTRWFRYRWHYYSHYYNKLEPLYSQACWQHLNTSTITDTDYALIRVALSTLGSEQDIFAGKCMNEKLTKCPNFTRYMPEKYFSRILGANASFLVSCAYVFTVILVLFFFSCNIECILLFVPIKGMNKWITRMITRKLCCRKHDRAMRPIHGCPEFSGLPDYAHGYYSQHFSWSFVPIDPMNVPTKFEVRSFAHSWDNRGYPKKLGSPWIRPRSLFSKIFNGLLFWLAV